MSNAVSTGELRTRLRAVAGDARLAIGATLGLLLFAVPLIIVIALRATGNDDDVGAQVLLGGLILMGVYVLYDVLGQTRFVRPRPERDPGHPRPWLAVVAILALLVLVPVLIAVVMSNVEDHLRGRPVVATIVVTVMVAVLTAAVGWLVRRVTVRRR